MTQEPQEPSSDSGAETNMPTSEGGMTPKEVRNWSMFCHLAALAGFIGIPAGNVVGPLVIWLMKKDADPKIDIEGKKSLNFQLTILIAYIIAAVLVVVVVGVVRIPHVPPHHPIAPQHPPQLPADQHGMGDVGFQRGLQAVAAFHPVRPIGGWQAVVSQPPVQ